MPQSEKAELVEGVVYAASPLRLRSHGEPRRLNHWLGTYKATFTPGARIGE